MLLLPGGSTLTMELVDYNVLHLWHVVVFVMLSGGGRLICAIAGEMLHELGDLHASAVFGIGLESGR